MALKLVCTSHAEHGSGLCQTARVPSPVPPLPTAAARMGFPPTAIGLSDVPAPPGTCSPPSPKPASGLQIALIQ